MTNKIMIQPGTSARGQDDHLVIISHLKDNLYIAELFREDGRTISGVTTLDSNGFFDSNWERCPGATKGEVAYHKKMDIEPQNDQPPIAGGEGYCSRYHKIVREKKRGRDSTNQDN